MALDAFDKKVVQAMKDLGATDQNHLKTADQIAKKAGLPKSIVNRSLNKLRDQGVVKRVARQKAAGYYLVRTDV